eukprot:c23596_g1_i1 orf=261-2384(+)
MGKQVQMHDVLVESSQIEDRKKRLRFDTRLWDGQGKYEKYRCFDGAANFVGNSQDVLLNAKFYVDTLGPVSVSLSSNCLSWQALEDKLDIGIICCWATSENNDELNQLAISEIYAVESGESFFADRGGANPSEAFSGEFFNEVHRFAVHAYRRSSSQKGVWIPKTFVFHHTDQSVCERWENQIQSLLDKDTKRPRNLMVIINPHSGKKSALKTWEEVSSLFKRAKINTKVLETERTRHAFEVINNTSDDDLARLDGVIIVGGDGLFNEVLNGLLLRRHRAKLPPKLHGQSRCGSTETLLPASADQHPLLNKDKLETACSDTSTDMSTHSLFSGSTHNGVGSLSHSISACSSALSCHESPPSMEYDSIFYKDGGFVIPSVPETRAQIAEQPIGAENKLSNSDFLFPNQNFRIGIIPAGSTDSIAVSTTGSRNAATSALHIILGENMALDVVRLVSWKSTSTSAEEPPRVRYAASFAGYGFYGDVIKESEPNRWMGPVRYDYAGTKVFFQHKLYEAEISYIELPEVDIKMPAPSSSHSESSLLQRKTGKNGGTSRISCRLNCSICANGIDLSEIDGTSVVSSHLQDSPRWKHLRGSFVSVGAAVISCRNDKAPNGVAASAHLADGLLHLILVKECSRLSYLWHLIQLTREDADPLDFAFVEEYKTPQFNFVSHGEESVWNVDGELFPAHQLSAQVFRGLINIFASGPDV